MKTAYPQTQTTCSIRLYCNIPFDNTYKHHTIISALFKYNNATLYQRSTTLYPPCEQFIDRKDYSQISTPFVYPRYDMSGEYNFNFSNGLIGSVTLELTPEQTNANYMRLTCGSDVYYYFITGISQVNYDTYTLSLELDALMTYQDEFLNGIKDKPVFTIRKHCRRYGLNLTTPYCADLKNGEDAFASVKPTLIKKVINLHYENADMKKIEDIMWLYVCTTPNALPQANQYRFLYQYKGKTLPLSMIAIPLIPTRIDTGGIDQIKYQYLLNDTPTQTKTITRTDIRNFIQTLINDGSIYSAKISPYPPFTISGSSTITLEPNGNYYNLVITAGGGTVGPLIGDGTSPYTYEVDIGNNRLLYMPNSYTSNTFGKLLSYGGLVIVDQKDTQFNYDILTPDDLDIEISNIPTITQNRIQDAKLFFPPFKKYLLNAQYNSEGFEFHPELMFADIKLNTYSKAFYFHTIATSYIGDNNFFTFISSLENIPTFDNYKYEKIGLANNVNYSMPCGTDALDVFKSTQAQSFYQSKTASGITSGLTIAGGVASVGAGLLSTGINPIASTGLLIGGFSAIGSGIASIANTIKSTTAKIEDLKNTPDSINISGSNYFFDNSIVAESKGLPYVVVYETSNVIKQNADDYLYSYGYQVSRDTYFNTELYPTGITSNNFVDNNIFGRSVFNFVQLQEDITNKINANIPLIVKQKISSIFNNGITLWSFFFSDELYKGTIPTSTYYLDNWFMKNKLDNAEYRG